MADLIDRAEVLNIVQEYDGLYDAIAALPAQGVRVKPDPETAFKKWWDANHDWDWVGDAMYERHAKECFFAGLAALTAAMDPALSERAGEVLERLQKADEYEPLGHDGWDAADLITALLAQNAALRAERDASNELGRAFEEDAGQQRERAEAAEAVAKKLREAADWQEKQRRDAFARRHINAPEDPHVAVLCERYGYGAVMDAASRLWARKDSVGAFYIGGCIGIKPDAALTTEADNG